MTLERDNLVTQLGVAYYNSEELRLENEQLRNTNDELQHANKGLQDENEAIHTETNQLRVKMAHIKAQFQDETQQWTKREKTLKSKIERREAVVQELQDMTRELPTQNVESEQNMPRRRSSGRLGDNTKNKIMDRIQSEIRKARVEPSGVPINPGNLQSKRSASRSKSKSHELASKSHEVASSSQRHSSGQERVQLDGSDTSEAESTTDLDHSKVGHESTRQRLHTQDVEDSRDITYLSFLDHNELAHLRKRLEDERRRSKQSRSASAPFTQEKEATVTKNNTVPRKSSLREFSAGSTFHRDSYGTDHFNNKSVIEDNANNMSRNVRIQSPHTSDAISYEEPKDTTDASILSTASRRRQRSKSIEEMTSAFIIPDITLHNQATVPTTDVGGLKQNIAHDQTNCTFCPSKNAEATVDTAFVPMPVSDREIDETNATIRPSQPPPVALANVLKQLQDEVAHLKLQLAALEMAYNAHDPALGRRKRKSVRQKMEALIIEVERRSDQIYSLYDVLEGQKQASAGAEKESATGMNEEAFEGTLQSLGIDAVDLAERAAKASEQNKSKSAGPHTSGGIDRLIEESDDDLPWEGISDESDIESVDIGLPKRRSVEA